MRNKLRSSIKQIVADELASRTVTSTGSVLPIGYNPIEYIRGGLLHWIAVPFNGTDVWCELRCPNATQLQTCGDITNITGDNKPETYSVDELIQIQNYKESLCKLVLNQPKYDEIASLVGRGDFVISEKRKELEELEKRFEEHKESMTETQKKTLQAQIDTINLIVGYILPDDTMSFLTSWAMGNDISDIKKIDKKMFLRAASLARAHNKSPTDYIPGVFTDYNKLEIDAHAFAVLEEFVEENKAVSGGKFRWIGGKLGRKHG